MSKLYNILNSIITRVKKAETLPDWNQSDETNLSYVKNRPFYSIPDTLGECALQATTLNFTVCANETEENSWFYNSSLNVYGAYISDYVYADSPIFSAEDHGIGRTYRVTWDDVDYYCVSSEFDGTELCCIGNPYLLDNKKTNTGEPFVVIFDVWFSTQGVWVRTFDISASHSIEIHEVSAIGGVVKMPWKYLPDTVAKASDVSALQTNIDTAQTAADTAQSTADTALTNAAIAQTTADGKMDATNPVGTGSFSMNRKADTTIGAASHAEGNNATASGYCSHAEGNNATASGYCSHAEGYETVANRMSQHVLGKYNIAELPSVAYLENRDSNLTSFVTVDKATARASKTYTFDATTGTFTLNNPSIITVDDLKFGDYFVYGSNYSNVTLIHEWYSSSSGGTTTSIKIQSYKINSVNIGSTLGKYAHIVGNGTSDTDRSNAHTLDWNGVGWFQGGLQVGGNSQDGEGAKSVLLDGDAIPVPVAAKVGQLLSVKAVDDNGVPTEWEVVDLPDDIGSGNSYDAIIEGLDSNFVLAQGSFEDLKTKILAGEQVYVDAYSIDGNNRWFYPVLRILYDEEDDEIEITTMSYTGSMQKFSIESDNGVYVY